MKTPARPRRPAQLDLFHPQPMRPLWRTLPPEVKRRVQSLLANLLKEHGLGSPVRESGKGASDE
jgi:hypothetical protein